MADTHSKAVRSYNMSKIRSKNTTPELTLRKNLFAHGFRFRLHDNKLPGKPDLVLKKYKTVIFVHGCFWHAHENCRYAVTPKSNSEYWNNKLSKNKARDVLLIKKLQELGWKEIVIWECELANINLEGTIRRLIDQLRKYKA